ncbi:MAG TPA: hypothetical protein VFF12_15820 [Myxococcaceae bacterium]|nr:hypothetical protein [Myxococcaceae bacterium]
MAKQDDAKLTYSYRENISGEELCESRELLLVALPRSPAGPP